MVVINVILYMYISAIIKLTFYIVKSDGFT